MEYDPTKFKIWTWKNPVVLHWILNPGLSINELLLGQSMPIIVWIEKAPSKSLQESTLIPCPYCGTLHSGLKWSTRNKAFRNWSGFVLKTAGREINCKIKPPEKNY